MSDIAPMLASHGVKVEEVAPVIGPTTTLHRYRLGQGTKVSSFANLAKDMAVTVGQEEVLIHTPIKGTSLVGVEVPNVERRFPTADHAQAQNFYNEPLTFPVGEDGNGEAIYASLTKMPHLLIAGQTGGGKSVALTTLIAALIDQHTPEQLRLHLVDPKRVELGGFAKAPHVDTVITDLEDVADALLDVVAEMDRRYSLFEDTGDRSIDEYNVGAVDPAPLPYHVVVVDELADLMIQRKKEVEPHLIRIAQLGRAAGIHLVLATQRPTRDVITGLIKANVPSRWAFTVASTTDSMVILDQPGASALIGKGDSLWFPSGAHAPVRVQAYLTPDDVLERVLEAAQGPRPEPLAGNQAQSEHDPLPEGWIDVGWTEGLNDLDRLHVETALMVDEIHRQNAPKLAAAFDRAMADSPVVQPVIHVGDPVHTVIPDDLPLPKHRAGDEPMTRSNIGGYVDQIDADIIKLASVTATHTDPEKSWAEQQGENVGDLLLKGAVGGVAFFILVVIAKAVGAF